MGTTEGVLLGGRRYSLRISQVFLLTGNCGNHILQNPSLKGRAWCLLPCGWLRPQPDPHPKVHRHRDGVV